MLYFLVVNCSIEHNILLGRPALFPLQAIPSTIHDVVKFSTSDGSATIISTKPTKMSNAQREAWQETQLRPNDNHQ